MRAVTVTEYGATPAVAETPTPQLGPLDAVFIVLARRRWRESTGTRATLTFYYSLLLYLALLFVALAAAAAA